MRDKENYIKVEENIVSCCFKCNQIKGKMSISELFSHIIKIFEYAIK